MKAIEAAGFEPIRPVAQGSHLIHGQIIRHLSNANLVLCDLSGHNPNVFFELGVRTSLNLPIALVRDEHTELPFDTSGINTHTYGSALRGWEIDAEKLKLVHHISESAASCGGSNPLWRQFGLSIRAQEPDAQESPLEAKVDLLTDRMMVLQARIEEDRFERLRDIEMGRDEVMLGGRDSRFSRDLAASDRTPPSALFSSALRRLQGSQHLDFDIDITGPGSASVFLTPDTPPSVVGRIRDLGARYGVQVDLNLIEPARGASPTARSRRTSGSERPKG